MAARGQAPTVLLLAAEPESDASGSLGAASLSPVESPGDSAGGSKGATASGLGDDDPGEVGLTSSDEPNGDDSAVAPLSEQQDAATPSPTAAASSGEGAATSAAASPTNSEGARQAAASSSGEGVIAGDDADAGTAVTTMTPAPPVPVSRIRSPLPLSAFPAPSLADTDELYDGSPPSALVPATDAADSRESRKSEEYPHRGSESGLESPATGRGDSSEPTEARHDGIAPAPDASGGRKDSGGGGDGASSWGGLLDVNIFCSGSGNCPLHEAAGSGSVGAVLSLLDLGADVSAMNARGDTALHVSGSRTRFD